MPFRTLRVRRCAATVALIALGLGFAEPAVGLARDGEVHHEGAVTAAQHADSGRGEHGHEHEHGHDGHEHGTDAASAPHSPDHQHGTTLDHCTHAHGMAVACSPVVFPVVADTHTTETSEPREYRQSISRSLFHPPRS